LFEGLAKLGAPRGADSPRHGPIEVFHRGFAMTTFQHDILLLVAAAIMPATFIYLLYVARTIGRKELWRKEEIATRKSSS
jgi:hypothetical protein